MTSKFGAIQLDGNGRPGSGGLLADRLSRTRCPQKVFADLENAPRILASRRRSSFWTRQEPEGAAETEAIAASDWAALKAYGDINGAFATHVRAGRRRKRQASDHEQSDLAHPR